MKTSTSLANMKQNLEDFLERFYCLNVGVIGSGAERHERPHKPAMLLAVVDLIQSGELKENRIDWSENLREKFYKIFDKVHAANDKPTPENPFFYLRSEGFWRHVATPGKENQVKELSNPPRLGELADGLFHVELDPDLYSLLENPSDRSSLRDALISRYFPQKRTELISEQDGDRVEEDPLPVQRRNTAFRRIILETYDYQCVACGIRIRMPNDITIVDAAHLIPFSISRNDHPTNGFALCKNHHWAFDRHLISPTEKGVWKVSQCLEARRSSGEDGLVKLEGERLLPPRDEAFLPEAEAVAWRMERLLS